MDRRRIVDEIEGPHVVQTADMVLVFVRKQDAVEVAHPRAEHLVAEIGSRVDHQPHTVRLDHGRGPQTVIAPVGRRADPAAASDHGHAL